MSHSIYRNLAIWERIKLGQITLTEEINKSVFSAVANNLLGKEGGAWGLISARMGRKSILQVLESCVFAKKMILQIK